MGNSNMLAYVKRGAKDKPGFEKITITQVKDDVVFRELTLKGSSVYNHSSWKMGLKIIAEHPSIAENIISHVFNFDDLERGFQAMLDRKAIKVAVHYAL